MAIDPKTCKLLCRFWDRGDAVEASPCSILRSCSGAVVGDRRLGVGHRGVLLTRLVRVAEPARAFLLALQPPLPRLAGEIVERDGGVTSFHCVL